MNQEQNQPGPSDQVASESRLTALLQEYQALSAEFRTLLTLGFVVVTMTGAVVAAALTVAFRLEREEILLVFPAAAIGIAIALTEFHMYYLSLGAYLANVEERINAILEQPPVLRS